MKKKSKAKDDAALAAKEAEKETAIKVAEDDEKTNQRKRLKEMALKERSDKVKGQLTRVDELYAKKLNDEVDVEPYKKFAKKYLDQNSLVKKQIETNSKEHEELLAKNVERINNVQSLQKQQQHEHLTKVSKLNKRLIAQEKATKEIRVAQEEDLLRRKELLHLNKQDQAENFQRGKHFQGLYKQKLVEKMWEK